jgi:hypothetical protein
MRVSTANRPAACLWNLSAISMLLAVLGAGCTKSPAGPSDTDAAILEGHTVSAIDGAASAGVQVQVGSAKPVTTDASGYFTAALASTTPGSYPTVVSGNGIVERRTTVAWPASSQPRLSLIPSSFDLRAFDEMFRTANGRLQRWTVSPALVVLGSVMSYKGDADEYAATSEQMTTDEVNEMVAHLTEALAFLTGGSFTSFASVTVERPAGGERASTTRDGTIVVGRYSGVTSFTNTIGYGRWAEQADGSVYGGAMFLDRNFDRDDSRRRLLRFHELGHALGYLHVESRASIMNPSIGPEPSEFDRVAAMIAFARPPGNVAPDTDPAFSPGGSGGAFGGRLRWNSYCAAMAARPPRSTNF